MTSVATARDHYVAEFEALERAGALRHPAWFRPVRGAAIARFAARGFPTPREEDWRYTNLAALAAIPFRPATGPAPDLTAEALAPFTLPPGAAGSAPDGAMARRLVFIDGRYSAKLSSPGTLPGGGRVCSLAEAMITDGDVVERHLGRRAGSTVNVFVDLNTALVQDGAFIHLTPGSQADGPLELLFLALTAGALAQPRTLIVAGPRSRVAVVERYVALTGEAVFTNAATEVVVGPAAAVDHHALQEQGAEAFHLATLHAVLERDATFSTCGANLGGRLARATLDIRFTGPGARAALRGLSVAGGRQHVDHHVTVDHAVPRCSSRQLYKGVLDDQARAVFAGRIVVRPDAQKTDASQTNKHLLLSDGVEVDSKPQLEIFADDVKCTHGAAEGQLAAEPLFYLKSRGLDDRRARALLTYGFAREVIETVALEAVRSALDRAVVARLGTERRGEAPGG